MVKNSGSITNSLQESREGRNGRNFAKNQSKCSNVMNTTIEHVTTLVSWSLSPFCVEILVCVVHGGDLDGTANTPPTASLFTNSAACNEIFPVKKKTPPQIV
jgi:hypothetical protein